MNTLADNVVLKSLKDRGIDPRNKQINVMMMYSGGADSLSLAKSILETTSHNLVLHHVIINNSEKRDNFQLDVIDGQLDYLRKNCREFEFFKTSFEMNLNNNTGIRDMSVSMFMAGTACRALRKRFSVIYTGHLLAAMVDFQEASAVINSLYTNMRFKPIWLYPLRSLNRLAAKREIYKNIGEEGLALTVSCRKPAVKEQRFVSCLKCPACIVREKAIRELSWDVSLVK